MMKSEHEQLVTEWSVRLMRRLYEERPRFCDVAIECIPVRRPDEDGTDETTFVYAHRAVLAARTQYFQNAFLGAAGFSEGATLQVQGSSEEMEPMQSVPSALYEAGCLPSAEDVAQMAPMTRAASTEIVKGSRVTFKESANVLQRIVEFMYLGEIVDLELGNNTTSEDDYNLWMWLLTWSFKHKVFDLFQYILSHLMCMHLTPAFAARLLDLQIENSFSMSASVHTGLNTQDEDRAGYNRMLDTLRGHAIEWFNTAPFDDDVFLPLNRQALLVVLRECVFEVSEYEVVRAVHNWTKNSVWVQKSYSSAPMPIDQVHVIMQHTDPFCLTIEEFDEFSQPPNGIFNHWTYQMYWDTMAVHDDVRFNPSGKCPDRTNLASKYARPEPERPDRTHQAQQPVQPAAPVNSNQENGYLEMPIGPGADEAPEPLSQPVAGPPGAPVLASIDAQARVDPNRPETAFVVGPNYYFKREEAEFRYLVSLSVTTYQGLMYRGALEKGMLKWTLEIVRQCDMFWMGVTSKSGLDMSTMIARDPHVWMISEEGTCIEHCRANAVTRAQPVRQRMNTLFIDCFKCINNPPTSWKKVIMELDSSMGDLYVTLNDRKRQHVFQNLPTHTRLFPCLMAVNTGQAHFELLEATLN